MLKEIVESLSSIDESVKIYRNDKKEKWLISDNLSKALGKGWKKDVCGVGLLEKFAKENLDKEFVFFYLGKDEYKREEEFDKTNKNKSEKLVRYASVATLAGGMKPLCILNADKGYMRFLNYDENEFIDSNDEWTRPYKFRYLRTVF